MFWHVNLLIKKIKKNEKSIVVDYYSYKPFCMVSN